MVLFYIIKIIVIIAALLSFAVLAVNSWRDRDGKIPNIFARTNYVLCWCIIFCALFFFDTYHSTLKGVSTTISILLLLILFITFFYKFILDSIKTKKINDAILYGIKGTYYTRYYDDDYGKVYLVRKYNYLHDFHRSSEEISKEYYGLLDIYDNDTHKYIRTVSEELLWDMIKIHNSKNKMFAHTRYFRDFIILYPSLQYSIYGINKDKFKACISEYEKERHIEVDYNFIVSNGEACIMIYNKEVDKLSVDIPAILSKVHEY